MNIKRHQYRQAIILTCVLGLLAGFNYFMGSTILAATFALVTILLAAMLVKAKAYLEPKAEA